MDISARVSAPDFEAIDSDGETFRLSDYRQKKHVVLIFNRGFHSVFCRRQMARLRCAARDFLKRGARVIVLGPEDMDQFSLWWLEQRMPFTGIPDPRHRVARLYNQPANFWKMGRMPTVVVVDRNGNIRMRHQGKVPSDIPPIRRILAVLDELNGEG